jgi:amino acid transporter
MTSPVRLLQVLTFWDLLVYGLVYVAPIGPWSTWAFAGALSGGAVALVFLLGALALLFTAYSYAKMVQVVPDAGSAYSYARFSLGDTAGFLTGWMILLDYLLMPGIMYVFCGIAFNQVIPAVPKGAWIVLVAFLNVMVNWFGVRTSARFNMGTLLVQLVLVLVSLAVGAWVLVTHHTPMFTADAWWGAQTTLPGLLAGTSLCVGAYLGFDAITTLSAEVRAEQLPLIGRAVVTSIVLLGALAVVNVWILSDLSRGVTPPSPDLTTFTYDVFAARIGKGYSSFALWVATLIIAVSILPPMVTGVSRVLYTMALKGEMPAYLARIDARYHVPHNAILTSGLISVVVALLLADHFDQLLAIINFGALCAFIAVNASVIAWFAWRRRSHRYLAHVLGPLIGIVLIVAVVSQLHMAALVVGCSWLAIGFVVSMVLRQRSAGNHGAAS